MKRNAWILAVGALATALAGCSAEGNLPMRDGGRMDSSVRPDTGMTGVCTPGQTYCNPATDTAYDCGEDGNPVEDTARVCRDTGEVCVNGRGCVACTPGSKRCQGEVIEECSEEGQWVAGSTCDANRGQSCVAGACVDRCVTQDKNYLGCEFWPTVTSNSELDATFTFAVALANPQTYDVRVEITGGTLTAPRVVMIPAGRVEVVELPPVPELSQNAGRFCGFLGCTPESVLVPNGAFHLQANGPIAAYQFNPLNFQRGRAFSYTNDASLLLPVPVLTQNYTVAASPTISVRTQIGTSVTLRGFVTIVAASDQPETMVTVRSTAAIRAGQGVPASGIGTQTYRLPRGAALQLIGETAGQDLTGSGITASAPIAVFAGHDCTFIPSDVPACDHLEEQLFPNETWGKRIAVTQLRDRNATESSQIRIMAYRANTTLTFDGITAPTNCARTLGVGQYCQFETASSFVVTGSEPILVTQFMRGQGRPPMGVDCAMTPMDAACLADPSMVTEVPIEQFRNSYDFLVPSSYVSNFVNITVPNEAFGGDGMPMIRLVNDAGATVPIAGSSGAVGTTHRVVWLPIPPGRWHIESMSTSVRFGIKVYGVAPYTSYMYPGGLDLERIAPPG